MLIPNDKPRKRGFRSANLKYHTEQSAEPKSLKQGKTDAKNNYNGSSHNLRGRIG